MESPAITRAQGPQISTAERCIGNCYAMVDRRAVVVNSLDVAEEEKLALDDGATDTAAEIVIVIRVLSQSRVGKEVPGIPVLVAVVFITRPVELTGARSSDLNNDETAGFVSVSALIVIL